MNDNWKLIVPVIHGIGVQDGAMQDQFIADLLKEVTIRGDKLLGAGRGAQLIADHLIIFRPTWDTLFGEHSENWRRLQLLGGLQPDVKGRERLTPADARRAKLGKKYGTEQKLKQLRLDSEAPIIRPAHQTPAVKLRIAAQVKQRRADLDDLARMAAVKAGKQVTGSLWGTGATLVGSGLLRLVHWRRQPLADATKHLNWQAFYGGGREFQAHTLSDIVMYLSQQPRTAIIRALLRITAERILPQIDPATSLYVLFCGHSQGSVVAYDFLRAIVEWNSGKTSTVFDPKLLKGNMRSLPKVAYWDFAEELFRRAQPVGMFTFGSPIPFFLYRHPGVIGKLGYIPRLRDFACPHAFRPAFAVPAADARTAARKVQWRWQNLYHPADFVAHPCEPFFNLGLPAGIKFVEDIELPGAYPDGVIAHSSYWGNRASPPASGAKPPPPLDPRAGAQTMQLLADRVVELLRGLADQAATEP